MFQEVIRPFSAYIAALNADRTRGPVSKCIPFNSQKQSRPGRVAEVARYPSSGTLQPEEAQQPQGHPPVSSLNRSHESEVAAAAGGETAKLGSASETQEDASLELTALEKDLSHLQQLPSPQDTQPANPTPAVTSATQLSGVPFRARLGTAGSRAHTAGGQLLRQPARSGLWGDGSRKLQSAPSTGQHDIKASQPYAYVVYD